VLDGVKVLTPLQKKKSFPKVKKRIFLLKNETDEFKKFSI
jgi:hypothetical protein